MALVVMLQRDMTTTGFDGLGVAFPDAFVSMEDLAVLRAVPAAKLTEGLGTFTMAVPDVDDDAVTLAAAATSDAFARSGVRADDIGVCIVGT